MTDYLYHDGISIPIIRIGRGSSKFFSNLIRSYIKNHNVVNVIARGMKINLLIWVIFQISDEFNVNDMQIFLDLNQLSLSLFVYSNSIASPTPIENFEEDTSHSYIKVGKNSDEDTMHRLINKSVETYIIAAGSSCISACQLLYYAYSIGFRSSDFKVIKTYDANGNEKAGIKVYIFRNFLVNDNPNEMYSLSGEKIQEESV